MTDYAKLYESGRCKAIGVPWNEAEKQAVFTLKIPAEFVRRGCLTLDQYNDMVKGDAGEVEMTGKVPLSQLKKDVLFALCQKYKVSATMEATKETMIDELVAVGCPKSIPKLELPRS